MLAGVGEKLLGEGETTAVEAVIVVIIEVGAVVGLALVGISGAAVGWTRGGGRRIFNSELFPLNRNASKIRETRMAMPRRKITMRVIMASPDKEKFGFKTDLAQEEQAVNRQKNLGYLLIILPHLREELHELIGCPILYFPVGVIFPGTVYQDDVRSIGIKLINIHQYRIPQSILSMSLSTRMAFGN